MEPLFALHKTAAGEIVDAGRFDYNFKLTDWLKSLDIRAGDHIEFGSAATRDKAVTAPAVELAA